MKSPVFLYLLMPFRKLDRVMRDLFHRDLPGGTTLRFVVRDDIPNVPAQDDGYVKSGTVLVAERFWVDVFFRNEYNPGDAVIGPMSEKWVVLSITKNGNYLCERADKIERRESVFLASELKPANGN